MGYGTKDLEAKISETLENMLDASESLTAKERLALIDRCIRWSTRRGRGKFGSGLDIPLPTFNGHDDFEDEDADA